MPNYCGLCTCIVDSDGPTLVKNKGNALLRIMSCTSVSNPSISFMLTLHQTTLRTVLIENNASTTLIQSQKDNNQSSALCAFCKKVISGHDIVYDHVY